jgi:glycerophosphoryl diester phosphodiesterase
VDLPSPVAADEPTPAQRLIASERVLVIAHRGDSSAAPENTLPAFQTALDAQADLVELDYHHSADGVPVVIHDEILDRLTNAEAIFGRSGLLVSGLPLSDLHRLDVGGWFDDRFAGTRLPTLSEALDLIQSRSITVIERKSGDAQTLVRLLEQKQLTDRVVVLAFDWEFVTECRSLAPRLVLGALGAKPPSEAQLRAAAATGADLIVWDHQKIGRHQISLIHYLGKRAWVYTLDDPPRAGEFMAAGIDGIITNTPAEMLSLRRRQQSEAGRRVPGATSGK